MNQFATTRLFGVALAVLLAAGCAASTSDPTAQDSSTGPASTVAVGHVHGLGVDPADGRIYVAGHHGLFRAFETGRLEQVGRSARDLMGFTVAGPATFFSSGHPDPAEQTENPLGLTRSDDAGTTWTPVSQGGEVDFHALEVSANTIYGLAADGELRVSNDRGLTWQSRPTPEALDIAVHPADPALVLASVEGGTITSIDGAATFTSPAGPQLTYLSWAPDGAAYGLDLDATLHVSTDRGATWQPRGTIPGGRPQAITALGAGRVLAATAGGIYELRDGPSGLTRIA